MSSILTNNSAMVALQTLKGINKNLANVQGEISTGKSVANAKDNAAVWAISKVMESDVMGFKAISSSLSLGESTVAVGRNASETVTDLLTEIKGKITGAQEENVDRAKLQTDIEALTAQIESVVGAAQFNGSNLLDGNAETLVSVLSSINRANDGSVRSANIDVTSANLSTDAGTVITDGEGYDAIAAATTLDSGDTIDLSGTVVAAAGTGGASGAATDGAVAREDITDDDYSGGLVANDVVTLTIGDVSSSYRVKIGDTAADINNGLFNAAVANGVEDIAINAAGSTVTYSGNDGNTQELSADRDRGDNYGLSQIDVSTADGAASALGEIEGMIQKSIDASAAFGSVEKRITIQSEFISKLTDSLKSGIGSLVDANMEEASARLQALQVQQQLGVQSLSIANQAPQSILSLFR